MDREIENEIARGRKEIENDIARERKERENEIRQMREQLERERKDNADLRDKLSRASLTPQVNKFHFLIRLVLFLLLSFNANALFNPFYFHGLSCSTFGHLNMSNTRIS